MASVFISYSRSDQPFVRKLYETLVANHHEVFVDWEGIPPSSEWKSELEEAIDKADIVVCVLSPEYLASPSCLQEVAHAEADKKRLIPILHREVPVAQVPASLAAINWIFFRSDDEYDAGVATLEQAIATDLNYVKAATRLLVRAKEWDGKKQNGSYLLRGSDLADAEGWLAQSGGREPAPSQLQTQYVFVSRRAASRRQRILISTLSIFLVIVVALSGVALVFYHTSEINRQKAVTQQRRAVTQSKIANVRALAAQCNAPTFGKNLDTRLLLCLLAVRDSERDNVGGYYAHNSLLSVIEANQHVVRYLHTPGAKVGDGNVNIAQSGDGKELASISDTGFFLWGLSQPNVPPVKIAGLNSSDQFYSVAMSANGQDAAGLGEYFTNDLTDNDRNDLLIVNASTSIEVKYYPYLTQSSYPAATATDVSLSADGKYIVSSFFNPSPTPVTHVVLWPTSGDPSKPAKKVTVPQEIDHVVMSPDGKWVGMTGTTGVTANATYLWNLTTGVVTTVAQFGLSKSLTTLPSSPTGGIAFNFDGTKFVASGFDSNSTPHTTVWDLSSGHPVSIAKFPFAGDISLYGTSAHGSGGTETDGMYILACAGSQDTFTTACQNETLTDVPFNTLAVDLTLSLSGLGTIVDISGGSIDTTPLAMGTDTGDIIVYLPFFGPLGLTDQIWPVNGPIIGASSPVEIPLLSGAGWLSPNGQYVTEFMQSESAPNGSLQVWHTSANPNQPLQEVNAPSLTKGLAAPVDSSSTPKIALANDASEIALSDDNANDDNNIILRHANGQTLTLAVSSLIADLSFDWSGKQVAAIICTDKDSCKTAELRVWDTSSGKLLSRYTVNDMASLAFMPDEKIIIVGGINALEFVSLSTHQVTPAQLLNEAGTVRSMTVSEDGQTLAAAIDPNSATQGAGPYPTDLSAGGNESPVLQFWDLPTQQPLGTPLDEKGVGVNTSFAFTSSGDIFDSSTGEFLYSYPVGIAHLQALACQMAHRNLTPSEWQLYAPNDPESTLCPQTSS